jgi:hypothetical protein
MEKVDRLGWTDGLIFKAYGTRFGIRTNNSDVLERVQDHLPLGWEPDSEPVVDILYSLRVGQESKNKGRRYWAVIAFYLSMDHRGERMDGCPIVALGSDAARQSSDVKASFEAGIKAHLELLGRLIGKTDGEEVNGKAMAILATMVGAVLLSRVVNDEWLSKRFLQAAANSVLMVSSADDAQQGREKRNAGRSVGHGGSGRGVEAWRMRPERRGVGNARPAIPPCNPRKPRLI